MQRKGTEQKTHIFFAGGLGNFYRSSLVKHDRELLQAATRKHRIGGESGASCDQFAVELMPLISVSVQDQALWIRPFFYVSFLVVP